MWIAMGKLACVVLIVAVIMVIFGFVIKWDIERNERKRLAKIPKLSETEINEQLNKVIKNYLGKTFKYNQFIVIVTGVEFDVTVGKVALSVGKYYVTLAFFEKYFKPFEKEGKDDE